MHCLYPNVEGDDRHEDLARDGYGIAEDDYMYILY